MLVLRHERLRQGHGHDVAASDEGRRGGRDKESQYQRLALDGAMGEPSRIPILTATAGLYLTQLPPGQRTNDPQSQQVWKPTFLN